MMTLEQMMAILNEKDAYVKNKMISELSDEDREQLFREAVNIRAASQPVYTDPAPAKTEPKNLQIWKIISGILSIIFTVIILFQSCAANVAETIMDNGGTSGAAGVIVAILTLVTGLTSIVARKSKGGNIAIMILAGIGAIIGFTNIGIYKDLIIWSIWLVVLFVMAFIALITYNKPENA